MFMEGPKVYGETRARAANVSYPEVERAALEILATGHRPSVGSIRARLGRGSPATIAADLRRFWKDLGYRAQNDPAALTRLPGEIIETVESLWQRALALAAQSAKSDHNAARERLEKIKIENEARAQSFDLRERAYESAARERERALADSRDHLLSTLRMLESDRVSLRAREARITELESQVEDYRQQLARLIARAVVKNRSLFDRKLRPPSRRKPGLAARRGPSAKKPRPTLKPKRRART